MNIEEYFDMLQKLAKKDKDRQQNQGRDQNHKLGW
jgi:hypothetical protein